MPKPKRQSSGNESDSDDGGFLTRFHHLPTVVNSNAPTEPVRIINVRENTLTSSYVLTSSRTVITVSMIFALLESLLCGLGALALYEDFESEPEFRFYAIAVCICFVTGEGFRIYLVSRWWGINPRSDIEPNRAYTETMKCFKKSAVLLVVVICPICLVIFFVVFMLAGLRSSDIPKSLGIFVLVAGFDLVLFIPCFACPTAICAACFWRRIVRRHERGMEYLRQNET